MKAPILLVGLVICLASCSQNSEPTIDEVLAKSKDMVADKADRSDMEWQVKRAKELLELFTGDDGSKLPYKVFFNRAGEIMKHPFDRKKIKDVVTENFANYINWFCKRNNITTEEALRDDYILQTVGVNLIQYDMMMHRLRTTVNVAAGRDMAYVDPPKGKIVPLKVGDVIPNQNPQLTKDERSLAEMCKTTVHEVWKE